MEFNTSNLKVGVVTVTYNSESVIEGFMHSLLAQTHENFILYVIDNNSTDRAIEIIINHFNDSRIVIIPNKDNLGVAAGNNQGIESSIKDGCKYVLLINNDTEFDEYLLKKLISGIQQQECDIIVPKIMFFPQKNVVWSAGGYFRKWTGYQPIHYGENEVDSPIYNAIKRIEYAPTCCMLISTSTFNKVGLMDERYFVYWDDADFCLRALRAGLVMYYLPSALLFHKVSSLTGGQGSNFSTKYLTRNFVFFLRKNFLVLSSIWLILYYIVLLAKFILKRDNYEVFKLKQKSFLEGIILGQVKA